MNKILEPWRCTNTQRLRTHKVTFRDGTVASCSCPHTELVWDLCKDIFETYSEEIKDTHSLCFVSEKPISELLFVQEIRKALSNLGETDLDCFSFAYPDDRIAIKFFVLVHNFMYKDKLLKEVNSISNYSSLEVDVWTFARDSKLHFHDKGVYKCDQMKEMKLINY